jgi:hypothetical protein
MSKRAILALMEFPETNLFIRGLVPVVGFPSTIVYYARGKRAAGESKYPLKKMLAFAIDGITSFSTKPIRLVFWLGIIAFFVSLIVTLYSLVRWFTGETVLGWTSMLVSIWAIGGIQLISIGVLGEYVGKIFLETKKRPRFIISDWLNK